MNGRLDRPYSELGLAVTQRVELEIIALSLVAALFSDVLSTGSLSFVALDLFPLDFSVELLQKQRNGEACS